MKLGATSINLGQIGANPRPAGLPLLHFFIKLRGEPPEPEGELHQDGFCKLHKKRPKGLNQVKLGSKPVTNQRTKAQLNLRSTLGLKSSKSVQHEPKPSQS